jgi:hypothetical protein
MIEEEQKYLYKVNTPYKCFLSEQGKADKYATVSYMGNRYSVPDTLVGKMVDLKIFAEHIIVYYNAKRVHRHNRSYGAHTWTLELSHYLHTLLRKPGALANSLALQQADEYLRDLYVKYFKQAEKQFIELLYYCQQNAIAAKQLSKAVQQVSRATEHDVSKDKIIVMLEYAPSSHKISSPSEHDPICSYSQETLEQLSQLVSNN